MVDLPAVPDRLVVLRQPSTSVSPSDVSGPGLAIAGAMQNASNAIDEGLASVAEEAGRSAVVRKPDGSVAVEKIPVFGRLGEIYSRSAMQAGQMQTNSAMQSDLADLARKTMLPVEQGGGGGNPDWFDKQSGAYVRQLAGNQRGGMQGVILEQGSMLADQFSRGLRNQAFEKDTRSTLDVFEATIADQKNTILALARQSGTNSPEYADALHKLQVAMQSKVDDPRMGFSPEQMQHDIKTFSDEAKANAVVGMVDRTFDKGGKAAAQKMLTDEILNNPDLSMDDATRSRLYQWGMSRTMFRDGDRKQEVAANQQIATQLIDDLRAHRPVADGQLDETIARAHNLGDADTVQKLEAFRTANRITSSGAGLTDDQRIKLWTQPSGKPGSYAEKVMVRESGGSATAANPNSTALGLFQFTADTWKGLMRTHPDLGLTEDGRTDPQQSIKAMRAFTNDNANFLGRAGIETTEKNLYLAHFLGAGGAKTFIEAMGRNPDLAAAAINPKAAEANRSVFYEPDDQGRPGQGRARSLAEVYNIQTKGLAGTPAALDAGADSYPGTPFTRDQVASNPYLPSALFAMQSQDTEGAIASAGRVGDAILNGIRNEQVPNLTTLAAFKQLADLYPEKLGAKAQQVYAAVEAFDDGMAAISGGPTQGAELLRQADNLAQGGSIYQQQYAEELHRTIAAGQARMQAAPFDEAARRGWVKPIPPLNANMSPRELVSSLQARGGAAMAIGARTGQPVPSILQPDEKAQMGTFLETASADQVVSTLAMMGQTLSPDVMAATMRDLYGNERARPYVVAAYFTDAGQPQTAQNIVVGERILAQKPDLVQDKFKSGTALDTPSILPVSLFAPGVADTSTAGGGKGNAYSDIVTIAKSIYAAKKGVEGTKDYDPALWKAALTEASGGIVYKTTTGAPMAQAPRGAGNATPMTYGDGQAVIAPRPGMTQAEFSARLITIRDEVFASMAVGSGEPITRADFMDHAQLQALGSGQYAVMLGNGAVADIRTGKPFVLDLR